MMRRYLGRATLFAPMAGTARYQASVPPRRPLHNNDSFLTGSGGVELEGLYLQWLQNPSSVDDSFHDVFSRMKETDFEQPVLKDPIRILSQSGAQAQSLSESGRLSWMIQCFEHRGHLLASLDPLNYEDDPNQRIPARKVRESVRVDTEFFGFTAEDLRKTYTIGVHECIGGLLDPSTPPITLADLHQRLVNTYCGNIGWEINHVDEARMMRWLREQIETPERVAESPLQEISNETRELIADDLAAAIMFEKLFEKKYGLQKRFGLDGGESLIVGLKALIERAAERGVEEAVIGMAHRGRLSSLHNVCGKPFAAIVKEFEGLKPDDFKGVEGQGDVKYHLGARNVRKLRNGKDVLVEMLCNPSHLECVNPFVQGRTKASQVYRGDKSGTKVLPIEIHGDAAFSGQGITFETMGLSELGKYHTGGTMHIVVNNQIGFTTDPKSSRSTAHCTDLGRVFHCPVFHVNGDRPEDVYKVFRLAADYRAKFNRSVVIDLVCYRRYGHNEGDDPTVTQPLMYNLIKARKDIYTLYSEELVEKKILTKEKAKEIGEKHLNNYMEEFKKAASFDYVSLLKSRPPHWEALRKAEEPFSMQTKLATKEDLAPVIKAISTFPPNFELHTALKGIMKRRAESLAQGVEIDWGTAEALALGTLLNEGFEVRISGQDVERATFSQRHAVLHDQKTDETYTNLEHISEKQGKLVVTNSSLSEFGVLGFDSGYAMHHPNALVMWEAQFGDFANGAQVVFDNFLAAGESKWSVEGLCPVVSMPHGYDGNGPEHSSGRIERFLQLVNEDEDVFIRDPVLRHAKVNMEVTYPSTPAQYYHLLRRHMHRNFRKPWINFFSKAFLRAPNLSTLDDMTNHGFQPVIADSQVKPEEAEYVLLCSGQIYFYLNNHRSELKANNVAILRVEQLAPFPAVEIEAELAKYSKTATIRWVQEEPKNMGAWGFVEPRLHSLLNYEREVSYVGRQVAASPAAGYKKLHDLEHKHLLKAAFKAN